MSPFILAQIMVNYSNVMAWLPGIYCSINRPESEGVAHGQGGLRCPGNCAIIIPYTTENIFQSNNFLIIIIVRVIT